MSKEDKNNNEEMNYNKNMFVSTCCNAFNFFNSNNIYCSKCGKIVKTLEGDEQLPINVKFNINSTGDKNISGDIIKIFHQNASKFAHDPTCELINKECPKCHNKTARYIRDPLDDLIYICDKCRHVF